jgi:two-component system sensor histidine kinase BaeS
MIAGRPRRAGRHADERFDRFVSGLSRQLGQCALLIESGLEAPPDDSEEHDAALARAWLGTDRLRWLNHELLDLGQVSRRPPRPAPVDPKPLLHRAAARLAERAPGPWRLEAGDLPAVTADPSHVEALFGDLLRHAVAARGEEAGTIRVSGRRDGAMVTFAVADEGRALGEDEVLELFEVGTRLRGSGSLVGAGLALVAARRLVEANGGGISARSEPGAGVVVTFTLRVG